MVGTSARRWAIALVAGAAIGLAGAVSGVAQAADSDDPIKIPIHNWSSQIVGAHVLGKILNGQGFSTEFIPADSQVVYTMMDAHAPKWLQSEVAPAVNGGTGLLSASSH